MALPDGYGLRAPSPDDLDAVAEVLIADELDDAGESTLGADFVRGEWSRGDFDAATDAWVVTDAGTSVVAYAQVTREDPSVVGSWGVVRPTHRGLGIGAALVDRIEARAAVLLGRGPHAVLRHSLNARDAAAQALLAQRGYAPVRHFWHMEVTLARPLGSASPPEGIEVRGIDGPDDARAVHAVIDEALAEHFGHRSEPFDSWMRDQSDTPGYDPALWLLATEQGRAVGALTASLGDARGWVDYLGVLAPYRGRGIAASLLRHCFALFAGRGIRRVLVSVDADNVTGATSVYERAGMRVVKAWDVWERGTLDPGRATGV
jgi:mycothiol synthase